MPKVIINPHVYDTEEVAISFLGDFGLEVRDQYLRTETKQGMRFGSLSSHIEFEDRYDTARFISRLWLAGRGEFETETRSYELGYESWVMEYRPTAEGFWVKMSQEYTSLPISLEKHLTMIECADVLTGLLASISTPK